MWSYLWDTRRQTTSSIRVLWSHQFVIFGVSLIPWARVLSHGTSKSLWSTFVSIQPIGLTFRHSYIITLTRRILAWAHVECVLFPTNSTTVFLISYVNICHPRLTIAYTTWYRILKFTIYFYWLLCRVWHKSTKL